MAYKLNEKEIRVAVIDDKEDDFLLLSTLIKKIKGKVFIIHWYTNYEAAIEIAVLHSYHIYFIKYELYNNLRLDLSRKLSLLNIDCPIVLLTGPTHTNFDISGMCGVVDYLKRLELNVEIIERCIRYTLEKVPFIIELKTQVNKYRKLFEEFKDALFLCDINLFLAEVNPAAISLLNFKRDNIIGSSLYDFIDDEVQKGHIANLLTNKGSIENLEVKIKNDKNQIRNYLLSLHVLQSVNQKPLIRGIIHDITIIKKTESDNLQSEKSEAVQRVIRMLAHEIRNPLNNILLSVEQLKPVAPDETTNSFLEIIQRNSLRINQVITDLLNLYTPSDLVYEKYALQEIIDTSLLQVSEKIIMNNVTINKAYPALPSLVTADKTKLIVAFTNILNNAIEAMEIDQGILTIEILENSKTYTVSIKDNGKGIPREYLSRLYDPFFTLKKNGKGLGLTASFYIIQSHKGRMDVESKVDEGTNFFICFDKN